MLHTVEQLVRRFLADAERPIDTFYNEASLQHELALFLRSELPKEWRLHIERPASWFRKTAKKLTKKEIDLVVADANSEHVVAIELKCPRQGQHPEQMFKACQDLEFLEQLVEVGFTGGLFVMHVDDPLFYSSGGKEGIYAYFRGGEKMCGTLKKPTGAHDLEATIRGPYTVVWTAGGGSHQYWVQTVTPAA